MSPLKKALAGRLEPNGGGNIALAKSSLAAAALSSLAREKQSLTFGSITDRIASRTDSPRHRIGSYGDAMVATEESFLCPRGAMARMGLSKCRASLASTSIQ